VVTKGAEILESPTKTEKGVLSRLSYAPV